MKILQWFDSLIYRQHHQAEEAQRQHRYEYGVREVERWTRAKKATAKNGADLTQRFQEKIAEHAQQWGTEGEGMKILRWNMESYQEQTEQQLQEAEYRLTVYRNIVLMQGRI